MTIFKKMQNSRKYKIILFISGVLIVILLNLKSLWYIFDLLSPYTEQILEEVELKLYYIIQQFIIHLFAFQIIAFYNYSWKNKVSEIFSFSKSTNIIFIIAANLFLFFLFAFIPSIFTKGFSNFGAITYFLLGNFFVYVLAVSVAYFFVFLRQVYVLRTENQQLKTENANAELASLKEQISPHFFFNTLNTLSSLIRTQKREDSLEFIEKMSEVYRYILDSTNVDLVMISKEIEFVNNYFYLLKKRFGEKITLQNDICYEIYSNNVPPLGIQLLIENAIQHNIISSSSPLIIKLYNDDNMIVAENKIKKKDATQSLGLGLSNLNKRYQLIANKEIEIIEKNETFIVKLPVID
jgi:two-component system LytT family sensor kinase